MLKDKVNIVISGRLETLGNYFERIGELTWKLNYNESEVHKFRKFISCILPAIWTEESLNCSFAMAEFMFGIAVTFKRLLLNKYIECMFHLTVILISDYIYEEGTPISYIISIYMTPNSTMITNV